MTKISLMKANKSHAFLIPLALFWSMYMPLEVTLSLVTYLFPFLITQRGMYAKVGIEFVIVTCSWGNTHVDQPDTHYHLISWQPLEKL